MNLDYLRTIIKEHFKATMILSTAIMIIVIGVIDYVTGKPNFSILFIIPIISATWTLNITYGTITAFISAFTWFILDVMTRGFMPINITLLWNNAIRICAFVLVSHLIWKIRLAKEKEKELIEFIIHDLRSPMTNLLISLEKIKKDHSENSEKFIDTATTSGTKMIMMMNSLLDLTRLEKGKMPKVIKEEKIQNIVDEAVSQFSSWANKRNIKIIHSNNTSIVNVNTDRTLVDRILLNLLSNAIKVSPKDSAIEVQVGSSNGKIIVFSVSDHGPGIPQNMIDSVFDKYTQITLKTDGMSGSGMGLTFCKYAVKELGGKIWIKSQKGKGTTVYFTLPILKK